MFGMDGFYIDYNRSYFVEVCKRSRSKLFLRIRTERKYSARFSAETFHRHPCENEALMRNEKNPFQVWNIIKISLTALNWQIHRKLKKFVRKSITNCSTDWVNFKRTNTILIFYRSIHIDARHWIRVFCFWMKICAEICQNTKLTSCLK